MIDKAELSNYFDIRTEQFHDRSARWLFEDGAFLRGLLEILAIEFVDSVDFSQMSQVNRSFIPDNLREQESDMVFSVPFRSTSESDEMLIYILIEHQSTVDSTMGFRMLLYMTQLWDFQRREWESKSVPQSRRRLRVILPIVFYTGERRWNSPLTLDAMMDAPDELGEFIPRFKILLLSVKEAAETDLTKTDHALGWLLTVLRKENADKDTMKEALVTAISRINALDDTRAQERLRALYYLVLLILHRRPQDEHDELRAVVNQNIQHSSDREEVVNVGQSMAEHIFEQGEKQGEIRGEKRGERRGERRGEKRGEIRGEKRGKKLAKQEVLLKLLQLRFNEVPESVANQINLIRSASRLDTLIENALTAQTLDELGL